MFGFKFPATDSLPVILSSLLYIVELTVGYESNLEPNIRRKNIKSGLWQMFKTTIVRFVPILFNSSHCSPYS